MLLYLLFYSLVNNLSVGPGTCCIFRDVLTLVAVDRLGTVSVLLVSPQLGISVHGEFALVTLKETGVRVYFLYVTVELVLLETLTREERPGTVVTLGLLSPMLLPDVLLHHLDVVRMVVTEKARLRPVSSLHVNSHGVLDASSVAAGQTLVHVVVQHVVPI